MIDRKQEAVQALVDRASRGALDRRTQRWSPFFGQVVKLGPPMKDGPDDGQAEAVFG